METLRAELAAILADPENKKACWEALVKSSCKRLTPEDIKAVDSVISEAHTAVVIPIKGGVRVNRRSEKTVYKTEEKA